ncbi:MAG: DNA polymerase III subunit beta [Puniceicoccales bacterium]|jgi:DNA polymerase-3 subunit beta|nr:DNA polymerase III subunit beta [Puniceicoccales bacterium]
MKVSVERDALSLGLQQVMSLVALRPATPILGNVLMEAEANQLTMTTTNLDCSIRCSVAAEIAEPGKTTVNVRKFTSIVKAFPCEGVDLTMAPGAKQITLSCGGSVFRIITADATDFPPLPTFDASQTFSMAAADLYQMISQVAYAQSTDDHRQILRGIYFNFSDGRMTLVTTDGRRLATVWKEISGPEGFFTVPSLTVGELEKLLADGDEVRLSFNARQVAFHITYKSPSGPSSVYIISKVVEGSYPNYKQVIPGSTDSRVRINREFFLFAIQRAALVTNDISKSVKLTFCENLLEISASSAEYGDARERLAIVHGCQGPVEIGFNPRYLVEPLRALKDDEIVFEFRDHLSAGVIRNDSNFLCVIMPLRSGA